MNNWHWKKSKYGTTWGWNKPKYVEIGAVFRYSQPMMTGLWHKWDNWAMTLWWLVGFQATWRIMTAAPHHDSVPHDVVHGGGHTDLHATGTMVAVCYCYTQALHLFSQHRAAKTLGWLFSSEKKTYLAQFRQPVKTINYTLLEHPHSFHSTCFSNTFQLTHSFRTATCLTPGTPVDGSTRLAQCNAVPGFGHCGWNMGFTGALLLRKHEKNMFLPHVP